MKILGRIQKTCDGRYLLDGKEYDTIVDARRELSRRRTLKKRKTGTIK